MNTSQDFQLALQEGFIAKVRALMATESIDTLLYHAANNVTDNTVKGEITQISLPVTMSYQNKLDTTPRITRTLDEFLGAITQDFHARATQAAQQGLAEGAEPVVVEADQFLLGAAFSATQITVNGTFKGSSFNISLNVQPAQEPQA
jgi:gamma-glutamyl:cysteine ligase YbdK (ATP-grasp superfamily)